MSHERIILVEDHHKALDAWKLLKVKDAQLIHLDAHIDFGFYRAKPIIQVFQEARDIADLKKQLERSLSFERRKKDFEAQLNMGNYIYPAMRDGIVKSFCWIIPGGRREFDGSASVLRRMVKKLKSRDPYEDQGKLYGKDFTAADISSVKRNNLPVLLDIDVDYLLFDSLKKASLTKKIGKRRPWLYPDKFVKILNRKFPRRICTTIAYSVNGGFTPILYKFFGDETALRLERGRLSRGLEKVFSLRKKGIESFHEKDFDGAHRYFKNSVEALKKVKSPGGGFRKRFFGHLYLWLFDISWIKDKKKEARTWYLQALRHDPSLKVADNNLGPIYLKKRDKDAAREEFEKILFCDPMDHNARRGLRKIKDFAGARGKRGFRR